MLGGALAPTRKCRLWPTGQSRGTTDCLGPSPVALPFPKLGLQQVHDVSSPGARLWPCRLPRLSGPKLEASVGLTSLSTSRTAGGTPRKWCPGRLPQLWTPSTTPTTVEGFAVQVVLWPESCRLPTAQRCGTSDSSVPSFRRESKRWSHSKAPASAPLCACTTLQAERLLPPPLPAGSPWSWCSAGSTPAPCPGLLVLARSRPTGRQGRPS